MYARSRSLLALTRFASAIADAPALSAAGLGGHAKGFPIDMIAIPQCAIPHSGSCWRTFEKDFFAGSNQKE